MFQESNWRKTCDDIVWEEKKLKKKKVHNSIEKMKVVISFLSMISSLKFLILW